jgi:outer membrane cobalamin receptor
LDGDWEVGLAEIIYPNSWYNMKEEILTEYTYTVVRSYQTPDGGYNTEHTLHAGYYNYPDQIAKKCTAMFKRSKLSYDDITMKFTILVRDNDKLNISKRLSTMLGFDGKEEFKGGEKK